MKFGGKQRNPDLEKTELTKTKSHENFFNKMLNSKILNTKLTRAIVFTFLSAAVLCLPKLLKAEQLVENPTPLIEKIDKKQDKSVNKNLDLVTDEYNWRKLYVIETDFVTYEIIDSLNLGTDKNDIAISDTTYTISSYGQEIQCGVYADTVIGQGGALHDGWITNITHIHDTYESLVSKGPADFIGDSITTGIQWLHLEVTRYTVPGFVHWETEQNKYVQQSPDGSLPDGVAGVGIGYDAGEYDFQKSYYVNDPLNILSVPLSITESNKPQTIDMKAYPNPFNSRINIELDKEVTGYVSLFDVNGRLLLHKVLENESHFILDDFENLPSGTYTIYISSPYGNKPKTITLIK